MFQFAAFPPVWLWIHHTVTALFAAGFPHSDTRGSLTVCVSPRLFAAFCVLLRRLVPRHSPFALISLTCVSQRISITRKPKPLGLCPRPQPRISAAALEPVLLILSPLTLPAVLSSLPTAYDPYTWITRASGTRFRRQNRCISAACQYNSYSVHLRPSPPLLSQAPSRSLWPLSVFSFQGAGLDTSTGTSPGFLQSLVPSFQHPVWRQRESNP